MADSQIEEIRNKLNVLDVVGGYVKLTKTGINYRGVCPFHKEKSPSFFVSPTRQMWHCFGCSAGGSIFDFIMRIEGIEFGDALRILAGKAGVQLKRENVQLRTERQRLYEICELATLFFEKQLKSSSNGHNVETYLLKRGITKESIKNWRIGYSPDTWNGLTDFLISKNYERKEIIKAGLAIIKNEKGEDSYDRFRGRIMFPIFDLNSQIVGFGGRVFKQVEETAKYINTPQTLIYNKSNLLYGLNNAKLSVRKENNCVVTEGYTDVIMCHQAGFTNTVASSGTALTLDHLKTLRRFTEKLILCFDADEAGINAFERAHDLAAAADFEVRTIFMDGFKDPAEVVEKHPGKFAEMARRAKPALEMMFDRYFGDQGGVKQQQICDTKKYIRILLEKIRKMSSAVDQAHWLRQLANRTNIEEKFLMEELNQLKKGYTIKATEPQNAQPQNEPLRDMPRRERIAQRLVSLLMTREHLRDALTKYLEYMPENYQSAAKKIISGETADKEQAELMNLLSLRATFESQFIEDEAFDEEFINLCLQLKRAFFAERKTKLLATIRQAEQQENRQELTKALKEFDEISKMLHTDEITLTNK